MTEIGVAYISVVPEVNKAIQAAYSETAKGGRRLGEALGGGLSSGAGSGLDALRAKAQATAGAVQKATRDMAAAQKSEADATGALRVAAQKLNEVRDNSKAKASQLVAAEEALAKAQRNAEVASSKTSAAVNAHQGALVRAKTATDGFSTAQTSVSTSATKSHGAITKLNTGMGKLSGAAAGVGKGMAGMFAGFGALAAGAAISTGIGSAIKAASDLNETINKSNVIFKGNAAAMDQWASGAAKSMGLSKKAALESAAGFGNMFSQLGFSADSAAAMSRQIVQMSADLGSFNNLPTGEVTEMISAAFRGEYDSLQRLIPNISAARVESEAMAATGKKNAKELTAQEKATAVLAIVQKDGAAAAGDFAKTSTGVANAQKIQAATTEDLSAKFGEKLQPVMQSVQAIGIKIMDWITENTPIVAVFAAAIGVLAVAIGIWTAVQWALNSAMFASPVFWVIAAVIALIAAVIWAWNNFETFRNIVTAAWEGIKTAVSVVVGWFTDTVWPFLKGIWEGVSKGFTSMRESVSDAWQKVKDAVQAVLNFFSTAWDKVTSGVGVVQDVFATVWATVQSIVSGVLDWLSSAWDKVTAGVGVVQDVFATVWGTIESIVGGVVDWLNTYVQPVITGVFDAIMWVLKIFQAVFRIAWEIAYQAVSIVVQWFQDTVLPMMLAVFDGIKTGVQAVGDFFVAAWQAIKDAINAVGVWIQDIFAPILQTVWDAIQTGVQVIADFFAAAWEGIKNAINAVGVWLHDTFSPILTAIWDAIKAAFQVVADFFAAAWQGIQRSAQTVSDWFSLTLVPILQSIWNTIRAAFQAVADFFTAAWDGIKNAAKAVSDWFTGTLVPAFQRAWDSIKAAFQATADTIGGIWNRIKDIAKAPVDFIVRTVINAGLIDGINKVAEWLHISDSVHLNPIPWPPAGWAAGGWTGPGSTYAPAGFVHADEFVIKKKSRRGIESAVPGFLDALNAYGPGALGYAGGGKVRPVPGGFTTYSGHTGVDFPVATGTSVRAFMDGVVEFVKTMATSYGVHVIMNHGGGLQSIYGHLQQATVKPGQTVIAGDQVGLSDSTGNSTGPHLHFELRQNGQWFDPAGVLNGTQAIEGGALSNLKERVVNFFRDNIKTLLDKVPFSGQVLRDIGVAGAKKLIDGVADFFIGKAEATDSVSGTFIAGAGASQWTSVALQALALAGQPDSLLPLLLHRIEVESGGNPNITNYTDSNAKAGHPSTGLMQTIPSTFNAYAGALAGRGINDPLANIYAAIMYTNDRYRGNFGRAWSGSSGYAEGGLVEPLLLDAGGIIPRGVSFVENRTGAPEALYRGGGGMARTVIVRIGEREFEGYVDELSGRAIRKEAREMSYGAA